MSDGKLFFGVASYFIALTLLFGMNGQTTDSFFIGGNPAPTAGSPDTTLYSVASGILCAGSIALFFVTFGFAAIASLITCGTFISTFVAPDSTISAFQFAFSFLRVFFQLLTMKMPIPLPAYAFLVLAPAALMGYLGLKIIRGTD